MSRTPLSHSRIETFKCPFRFKRTVIDKKADRPPRIPILPFAIGNFAHLWTRDYVRHCVKDGLPSDYAWGESHFESLWAGRMGLEEPDFAILHEDLYEELQGITRVFMEAHAIDPEKSLSDSEAVLTRGAELEIALTHDWKPTGWMTNAVFFRAKIDYVTRWTDDDGNRVIRIDDWKTDQAAASQGDVEANPQLRRYILCMNHAGVLERPEKYEVCLDFVRWQIQRTVEFPPEIGDAEKERVMAVSMRVEQAKESGEWPAVPGDGCAWCDVFHDGCPARNLAGPLRPPQDQNESEAALAKLILVGKEKDDLQAMLKEYAQQYGTVLTGGMQYGAGKKQMYSYDTEGLIQWAQDFGVPVTAILKGDRKLLEKAAKGKEGAAQALEPLTFDKSSTEFRLKKAKT